MVDLLLVIKDILKDIAPVCILGVDNTLDIELPTYFLIYEAGSGCMIERHYATYSRAERPSYADRSLKVTYSTHSSGLIGIEGDKMEIRYKGTYYPIDIADPKTDLAHIIKQIFT